MGLYKNGGWWGPGYVERLEAEWLKAAQKVCREASCFIAQVMSVQQSSDDDNDGHLYKYSLTTRIRKCPREASTPQSNFHSDRENEPGPADPTSGYREPLDFKTKIVNLLEVDASRRAVHEEKMEHLASKLLEEVRVACRSLVGEKD